MAEEAEYDDEEEEEDEVSQKKEVENKEKNNPIPEKSVEKSEEKKETHSKKSKSKSSKNKNAKSSKNNENAYKLPTEHVTSTRSFLESTVTTAIQEALLELARKRDEVKDPLTFVGEYLINKAKEKNQ